MLSCSLCGTGNAAAAAEPRFLCVPAAGLSEVGLISGAPRVQPGPKQSLQFSYLLGHLPGLLCGTQGELELPVALGDGVSLSGFGEAQ